MTNLDEVDAREKAHLKSSLELSNGRFVEVWERGGSGRYANDLLLEALARAHEPEDHSEDGNPAQA